MQVKWWFLILLMEDILHHLGCIKPCHSGINYISTGAGFFHQQYGNLEMISIFAVSSEMHGAKNQGAES